MTGIKDIRARDRLANVAAVWRQAKPWVWYPQPFRDHHHRGVWCNPAWLALRHHGWRHGYNACIRYPAYERGAYRRELFDWKLRRWRDELPEEA